MILLVPLCYQSSFDNRIRELETLTKLTLRPGQVQALQSLAEGKDVVLVAKTGYEKTLIFTGYNLLIRVGGASVGLPVPNHI